MFAPADIIRKTVRSAAVIKIAIAGDRDEGEMSRSPTLTVLKPIHQYSKLQDGISHHRQPLIPVLDLPLAELQYSVAGGLECLEEDGAVGEDVTEFLLEVVLLGGGEGGESGGGGGSSSVGGAVGTACHCGWVVRGRILV